MSIIGSEGILQDPIIISLLDLGRSDNIDDLNIVTKFKELRIFRNIESVIGRYAIEKWLHPDPFSIENLTALLKGLAVAENAFRWARGSVSPIIQLYWKIDKIIDYKSSKKLANWIIQRNDNPWVPFRSPTRRDEYLFDFEVYPNFSYDPKKPRTVMTELNNRGFYNAELRAISREISNVDIRYNAYKVKQEIRDIHRNNKIKKDIERRILIRIGKRLDQIGLLKLIVNNSHLPIEFFPKEWANINKGLIKTVVPGFADKLLIKLGDRNKGHWGKLRRMLISNSSDRSNHG